MKLDQILAPIKEDLLEFDRKVKDYIHSDSPLIYQIASHILKRKGKRLRPSLVYLSAGACGKKDKKLTRAALAIELIHIATLLHDDVVDGSSTRRGQPTVNTRWTNLVSVLMGDYLLAKAFKIMMATESQPLLTAISWATERVSVGELLQVQECFNYDLDEESYLNIIRRRPPHYSR
jgi:octaprenyl-diphosphate synthase